MKIRISENLFPPLCASWPFQYLETSVMKLVVILNMLFFNTAKIYYVNVKTKSIRLLMKKTQG